MRFVETLPERSQAAKQEPGVPRVELCRKYRWLADCRFTAIGILFKWLSIRPMCGLCT